MTSNINTMMAGEFPSSELLPRAEKDKLEYLIMEFTVVQMLWAARSSDLLEIEGDSVSLLTTDDRQLFLDSVLQPLFAGQAQLEEADKDADYDPPFLSGQVREWFTETFVALNSPADMAEWTTLYEVWESYQNDWQIEEVGPDNPELLECFNYFYGYIRAKADK